MKTRRISGTGTVAVEHIIDNKNLQDFADFGRNCFNKATELHTRLEIESGDKPLEETEFTFNGKAVLEMAEMFDDMRQHMVNVSDDTVPTEDTHKENFTISSDILDRREAEQLRKDRNG